MKTSLFIISLIAAFSSFAQNPNLHFAGNAHVDIGPLVLNGARTIELWFKLDSTFHESSTSAQTLIARNTTWCNSCDEAQLVLMGAPLSASHTGQLRFGWQNSTGGNAKIIYSDTSSWDANKWYHIAGVIDLNTGMRLYVNGTMQSETIPSQKDAVTNSDTSAYLGKWGTSQMSPRYFQGKIENVRISSNARYTANFTPNCANDTVDNTTQGMWFLNHGNGLTAYDSSGNQFDGNIYNATWSSDSFCFPIDPHGNPSIISESITNGNLKVYPNPSFDGIIHIDSPNILDLQVFDMMGKNQPFELDQNRGATVDLSNLQPGAYVIKVTSQNGSPRKALILLR